MGLLSIGRDAIDEAQRMLRREDRINMTVVGRRLQAQIVATGQWTARRDTIRPAKPNTKPRRCLRCGKMFDSRGPGNRICCRGSVEGAEAFGRIVCW